MRLKGIGFQNVFLRGTSEFFFEASIEGGIGGEAAFHDAIGDIVSLIHHHYCLSQSGNGDISSGGNAAAGFEIS